MPPMMAVRLQGGSARLCRVEVPTPRPGEARVRVELAGVCRTDVLAAAGRIPCADGIVLGHEFAGVVDALGPGVAGPAAGRRVAVRPVFGCGACADCGSGDEINCPRRTMLGLDRDGAFAEFVCVPADALVAVPESLSWEAAAYAEPVAAALAVVAAVPPGRGLVLGRNRFAELVVRLLALHGHGDLGRHGPGEAEPEEGGYDFVVETGLGPDTLPRMARAARPGGTLVLKSRQPGELRIDPLGLVRKRLTIRAANYGPFRRAVGLLAEGRLDLAGLCGPAYPLEAFAEAFAHDADGEGQKRFLDPRCGRVRPAC